MNNNEYDIFFDILTQKGISRENSMRLLHSAKRMKLRSNEIVVRNGQIWNSCIIVISGIIRFYYNDNKFNEVNQNFLSEGNCIAPVWGNVSKEPSEFEIASIGESIVYLISYQELRKVLSNENEWHTFTHKILDYILDEKIKREKTLLTLTPPERYLHFVENNEDLVERIPVKHIASFISITDVSLSRIRKNLNMSTAQEKRNVKLISP